MSQKPGVSIWVICLFFFFFKHVHFGWKVQRITILHNYSDEIFNSQMLDSTFWNPNLLLHYWANSRRSWLWKPQLLLRCFQRMRRWGLSFVVVEPREAERRRVWVVQSLTLPCLSVSVGEECSFGSGAPWLHYLAGQQGLINCPLGEKHLSPRTQYHTHSYGVIETHCRTLTYTQTHV